MEHFYELGTSLFDQSWCSTLRKNNVDAFQLNRGEEESFPTVDAVIARLLRLAERRLVTAGTHSAVLYG